MGYCVGQWVGSCQITRNSIIWKLIKIIQFCLKVLGGLSLLLNHLIASCLAKYDWQFGTLPFRLLWSNLDTMDLETYPRTYFGHF